MDKQLFQDLQQEMLTDLASLVSIASLPDEATIGPNAPFGQPIRKCFHMFKEIAERKGFVIEDDEGYAITAMIGNGEAYVGVLGHLDIVDAGDSTLWNTPPYEMTVHEGMLYGRGVNDDKGPLLASLYAAWLIKKQNLPLRYPIHIIAGGAEETSWECMKHYFKTHQQPIYGFSPDGNFPIVNGEKGILQVRFCFPTTQHVIMHSKERLNYVCDELDVQFQDGIHKKYVGKRALSRNPQRGENAIFEFVKDNPKLVDPSLTACIQMIQTYFLDDFYGEKSRLSADDDAMGSNSVCLMSLTCDASIFELCVDIRYVKTASYQDIMKRLNEIASQFHAQVEVIKEKRHLYVPENSALIQALKTAYARVMNEDAPILTKGGASYARVLDRGVAFGATFPGEDPKPHMPNECMPIASLLKACEIYYEALYELAVDKSKVSIQKNSQLTVG